MIHLFEFTSSARFRIRADQVLFQSAAFWLAFLLKAVGPPFVGLTFRARSLTLKVRTDASAGLKKSTNFCARRLNIVH